jgi:hypothetical protein
MKSEKSFRKSLTLSICLYRLKSHLLQGIPPTASWSEALGDWAAVPVGKCIMATGVRDHLSKFIDNDDGIFIAKSTGKAAWLRDSSKSWRS